MPFKPTDHQVRKSIRKITKMYNSAAPIEDNRYKEEPGLQRAFVKKIDMTNLDGNGWQIQYVTGGTEWVGMSTPEGVDWIPDGEIVNNLLYPSDTTILVDVVQDSSKRENRIVSTRNTSLTQNTTPGTTQVARGNSFIQIRDLDTYLSSNQINLELQDENLSGINIHPATGIDISAPKVGMALHGENAPQINLHPENGIGMGARAINIDSDDLNLNSQPFDNFIRTDTLEDNVTPIINDQVPSIAEDEIDGHVPGMINDALNTDKSSIEVNDDDVTITHLDDSTTPQEAKITVTDNEINLDAADVNVNGSSIIGTDDIYQRIKYISKTTVTDASSATISSLDGANVIGYIFKFYLNIDTYAGERYLQIKPNDTSTNAYSTGWNSVYDNASVSIRSSNVGNTMYFNTGKQSKSEGSITIYTNNRATSGIFSGKWEGVRHATGTNADTITSSGGGFSQASTSELSSMVLALSAGTFDGDIYTYAIVDE